MSQMSLTIAISGIIVLFFEETRRTTKTITLEVVFISSTVVTALPTLFFACLTFVVFFLAFYNKEGLNYLFSFKNEQ